MLREAAEAAFML